MNITQDFPPLCLVLDPQQSALDPLQMVRAALEGGVRLIQLRDKRQNDRQQFALAEAIGKVIGEFQATKLGQGKRTEDKIFFLLNDRCDLAKACHSCDGVHLGQDDLHPLRARAILGSTAMIGQTVHNPAEIASLVVDDQAAGLDYISFGGVFPTQSKRNKTLPLGTAGLRELVNIARRDLPHLALMAIAGIDSQNASLVGECGIQSIAVMSAISGLADLSLIPQRCLELEEAWAKGYRLYQAKTHASIPSLALNPSLPPASLAPIPVALTIAGSDSGGGAGIQADLKSFAANRVFGTCVITALTAQNTQGVQGVSPVPPDFIRQQILSVTSDFRLGAIKIGMVGDGAAIEMLADCLCQIKREAKYPFPPIVLDPVMIAKGGDKLLPDKAIDSLSRHLLPLADVLTPNLPEAAKLLDEPLVDDPKLMPSLAKRLLSLGPRAVLVKGGHLASSQQQQDSPDFLLTNSPNDLGHWFHQSRIPTSHSHGTGCTLSAAIAAYLAHGLSLREAVAKAKAYLTAALKGAEYLGIGHGIGPLDHQHWLTHHYQPSL